MASTRWYSSASPPAISTPVGPPPHTTTSSAPPRGVAGDRRVLEPGEQVVAQRDRVAGGLERVACARRRRGSPKSWLIVPAATTRVSYVERTRRGRSRRAGAARSTPVTRAIAHRARCAAAGRCPAPGRRCRRCRARRWPPGTAAAGTCGSCWRRRSSRRPARRGARGPPRSPPNPAPITTTRWCSDVDMLTPCARGPGPASNLPTTSDVTRRTVVTSVRAGLVRAGGAARR